MRFTAKFVLFPLSDERVSSASVQAVSNNFIRFRTTARKAGNTWRTVKINGAISFQMLQHHDGDYSNSIRTTSFISSCFDAKGHDTHSHQETQF